MGVCLYSMTNDNVILKVGVWIVQRHNVILKVNDSVQHNYVILKVGVSVCSV